jgi:hypothetical protein
VAAYLQTITGGTPSIFTRTVAVTGATQGPHILAASSRREGNSIRRSLHGRP